MSVTPEQAGELMPAQPPDCTQGVELVLVAYRSREHVEELLRNLPGIDAVVVDNASGADGLPELLRDRPGTRYLDGGGIGFARGANLGASTSQAEVLLFVNPDARPSREVLEALAADVRSDPRCASSAALSVGPDGRSELGSAGWEPSVPRALAHAVALHKIAPRAGLCARPEPHEPITVDWTTGTCMAVLRATFTELGGFDESYFVYSEDVAFGRTVRARGMYQRLRTDLLVPHSSTGSGAPSLEMMRLRGASMARYVQTWHSGVAGGVIRGSLALGYLTRVAHQRLRRDPQRAREHLAYLQGLLTRRAYVSGVEVTRAG
jgi:GT2 family glycosyltransferase